MNWMALEQRLRQALKEAEKLPQGDAASWNRLAVRLDTILASETGRGTAMSNNCRQSLAPQHLDIIENEEWGGHE